MNTTDKPKCTAADGKTEVHNMPGVGLVVSAAAFNALVRDAERWRKFLATRPAGTHAVINEAIDAMQEKQS